MPDLTIVARLAAFAISASSAAEWPVVPMTWTMPAAAVSSAKRSVAAGVVNSINPSAPLQERRDIADDLDAVPPKAGELAGVAADDGRIRGFRRSDKRNALGRGNGMDQRTPHAPAGAGDHQPHVGICSSHCTRLWVRLDLPRGIAGRWQRSNITSPRTRGEGAVTAAGRRSLRR